MLMSFVKPRISHIFLLCLYIQAVFSLDDLCTWRDPISGATFHLESLFKPEGWQIKDTGDIESGIFAIDYMFNFCGPHPALCNGEKVTAYEALEV